MNFADLVVVETNGVLLATFAGLNTWLVDDGRGIDQGPLAATVTAERPDRLIAYRILFLAKSAPTGERMRRGSVYTPPAEWQFVVDGPV